MMPLDLHKTMVTRTLPRESARQASGHCVGGCDMVHQVLSEEAQGPQALTRDTLRPEDNPTWLSHSNCGGARTQRQDLLSKNHPVHVFVFKTTFW